MTTSSQNDGNSSASDIGLSMADTVKHAKRALALSKSTIKTTSDSGVSEWLIWQAYAMRVTKPSMKDIVVTGV